jgi:hypothetical protein
MQISKRAAVAMLTASAFAGSAFTAVNAVADQGGGSGSSGQSSGDSRGDHHGDRGDRGDRRDRGDQGDQRHRGDRGDQRGDRRDRQQHHFGHQRFDDRRVVDTSLAPSVPTDPMLHGNTAGGAPWVLKFGGARIRDNGRVDVVIHGLVIPVAPGNGTPGPVTTVSASLYCGADSAPAVATTASVPISTAGDARVRGQFTLPAKCLAPTVLIHPNGSSTTYIAASGFAG